MTLLPPLLSQGDDAHLKCPGQKLDGYDDIYDRKLYRIIIITNICISKATASPIAETTFATNTQAFNK